TAKRTEPAPKVEPAQKTEPRKPEPMPSAKPAPKVEPDERIEPTLKAEPEPGTFKAQTGAFKPETVTFKPETAADAWLGLLAARGIEYLFANGGTDFAPVVEAYAKGQKLGWRLPQVVIVPHENLGVAMAHGY